MGVIKVWSTERGNVYCACSEIKMPASVERLYRGINLLVNEFITTFHGLIKVLNDIKSNKGSS